MNNHFCSCPLTKCPRHPANHDNGCDPCIKFNLDNGKIPRCFFNALNGEPFDIKDVSVKGFVDFYLEKNSESCKYLKHD